MELFHRMFYLNSIFSINWPIILLINLRKNNGFIYRNLTRKRILEFRYKQRDKKMLIDISLPLTNDFPVWPGDPKINISTISSMDKGDTCNVSYMKMGVHAGTHIDAPHHFMNNNITVEKLSLDTLVGVVYVVEITEEPKVINNKVLQNSTIPKGIDRLIIKTENSKLWNLKHTTFNKNFVAIDKSGAEWIVKRGIKLVGVDYLSVAPFEDGIPTHQILLGAQVIIVEGLNLSAIDGGYYELFCLPLKIPGCDGSPARAVLKQLNNYP